MHIYYIYPVRRTSSRAAALGCLCLEAAAGRLLACSSWLHQVQPQMHQPNTVKGGREREDSACLLRCCLACWYGRILCRWWCPCPTPLRAPSPNQSNQGCTRASPLSWLARRAERMPLAFGFHSCDSISINAHARRRRPDGHHT